MPGRIALLACLPALMLARDNTNNPNPADLAKQIAQMSTEIQMLRQRVAQLESKQITGNAAAATSQAARPENLAAQPPSATTETAQAAQPDNAPEVAAPALPASEQVAPPASAISCAAYR